jgi:hypothetical protein
MSKVDHKLQYSLVGTLVTVSLLAVVEGKEPEVARSFALDAADFPSSFATGDEAVTKTLAGYGLQKLIQDRTSQVSESTEAKFDAMLEEGERLKETGEWRAAVERKSGGATPKADPILAQAVSQVKGLDINVATAALAKLDKEGLKKIRENDAIKAAVDAIRQAAKSAEAVSLEDLLG